MFEKSFSLIGQPWSISSLISAKERFEPSLASRIYDKRKARLVSTLGPAAAARGDAPRGLRSECTSSPSRAPRTDG